uniref:Uncharacterized protein n=1 Tax=Arion vulgaris TaxID=1028688 RepID=A0A0B7B9F6_9EUPU
MAMIKFKLRKLEKKLKPVRFDANKITEEYGVEVKNRFEILMTVQEEMTPDELTAHARDILLLTAKDMVPQRKDRKNEWIANDTLELIQQRREKRHRE